MPGQRGGCLGKAFNLSLDYVPGPGISFEEAVAFRKHQGYNSVSFVAAFPNWEADHRGATFANKDGVYLRNAWEKFGYWAARGKISTADGAITTAKDMADEQGERPFEIFADREGLANFDRINPHYFRSLDRKMRLLAAEGFVPFLETVRRDHGPSWKAYFDFQPFIWPVRSVPHCSIRRLQSRVQRDPSRLDSQGLQLDRR